MTRLNALATFSLLVTLTSCGSRFPAEERNSHVSRSLKAESTDSTNSENSERSYFGYDNQISCASIGSISLGDGRWTLTVTGKNLGELKCIAAGCVAVVALNPLPYLTCKEPTPATCAEANSGLNDFDKLVKCAQRSPYCIRQYPNGQATCAVNQDTSPLTPTTWTDTMNFVGKGGDETAAKRDAAILSSVLRTTYQTICNSRSQDYTETSQIYPATFVNNQMRVAMAVTFGCKNRAASASQTVSANTSSSSTSPTSGTANGSASSGKCYVGDWNVKAPIKGLSPATNSGLSCTGTEVASGSMENSDLSSDAARSCSDARQTTGKGSCCMFTLYGKGRWILTDGVVSNSALACDGSSACRASGPCL